MVTVEGHEKLCRLVNACRQGADNTTPIPLVQEMIDKIPEEVWKDTSATILDPAAGTGTFLVAAYWKMIQAGDTHENIISNRLFACEINLVYLKIIKDKLGIKNIYGKDFLQIDSDMKFDVIIGNPPYQDSSSSSESIKLWSLFSEVAINTNLKENGYLCFITPQHLTSFSRATIKQTKPVHRLQLLLEKYNFVYCDYTADSYFNVGTSICSWMIQKVEITGNLTNFVHQDKINKVEYKANLNTNPTLIDSIIDKVFYNDTHTKHHRFRKLYSKIELSENQSNKFNNPIIWNSKNADTMYSEEKLDSSFKLVIHNFKPFRISHHNLFITDKDVSHSYFYLRDTKKNLKSYQTQFSNLKVFKFLSENFKNSKGVYLIAQLQEIIPILDPSVNWNDIDTYREFNLTQEEIDLIESTVS